MAELALPQQMIRQFMEFIPARAILVAAKLGLADHIDNEGATSTQVASSLDVDPDAVHRLLRVLASIGVLHEEERDRFTLTSLGETLRSDSSSSVCGYAVFVHDFLYESFGGLAEAVRTGKPAFERTFGMPFFPYLQNNPDRAAIFHSGMGDRGRIEAKSVVDAYDFSTSGKIVDVGGGNGAFLSAILKVHANAAGVLMDRPAAVEAAKSGQGGPLPHCEFVVGDILDEVVAGGDIYTLKRLLFDFSDQDTTRILDNCRKAMRPGARLLIIEVLSGPSNQRDLSHAMDLLFLVMLGGRTRTAAQYAALLEQARFKFMKTIPTESDVSILEAIPA